MTCTFDISFVLNKYWDRVWNLRVKPQVSRIRVLNWVSSWPLIMFNGFFCCDIGSIIYTQQGLWKTQEKLIDLFSRIGKSSSFIIFCNWFLLLCEFFLHYMNLHVLVTSVLVKIFVIYFRKSVLFTAVIFWSCSY